MESTKGMKSYADSVAAIPANCINSDTLSLNVRSYAGYADSGSDGKLFYWFFESQRFTPLAPADQKEVENTPLAIWLNGGPGAPSTLGLFLENGPYRMLDGAVGEVIENKFPWNRNMHIMYWDQPFGTGYSYSGNKDVVDQYVKNEDELSEMFYNALQDFFTKHPEYRKCPLYVMGESYAGKYVPNIALKIHEKNQGSGTEPIALKGICVGDGWIDAQLQMKVYIDYAYTLGYIDTKQKRTMMEQYELFCTALKKVEWQSAYTISNGIVDTVSAMGGGFNVYNIRSFSDISMDNVRTYMELPAVKTALHVPVDQPWNCADNSGPVAENLIEDNMSSATKEVYSAIIGQEELYRVLMYTGTFDTACGSLSTEKILYDLPKWDKESDAAWKDKDRTVWAQPGTSVKGFIKQYKNLTQIVLPGSGHQVPYFLPEISLNMIETWLANDSFPTYLPSAQTEKTIKKELLEKDYHERQKKHYQICPPRTYCVTTPSDCFRQG